MKQGSASRDIMAPKTEPRAHAVSPTATDQMGNMLGNHVTGKGEAVRGAGQPLYKGRGYEAPHDAGRTVHRGGSQGRR